MAVIEEIIEEQLPIPTQNDSAPSSSATSPDKRADLSEITPQLEDLELSEDEVICLYMLLE